MKKEILRMERVTYKEHDVAVLQEFELNIMEGEIVGLIVKSDMGLARLLDILHNNTPIYYGYVYYMEQKVNSWQDMKRSINKISIISGKSSLVGGQTVATNIFVLRPGFRQYIIQTKILNAQVRLFFEEINVNIDPDTLVEKLSALERVIVEIVRGVVAGHHLIVLNEIGTIVNENELEELYRIVNYYASKGVSFLHISFHFEETIQNCSRTVYMSDGKIIMSFDRKYMNQEISMELCKNNGGYEIQQMQSFIENENKEVLLDIRGLSGTHLKDITMQVYKGECLAVQCLDGKTYEDLHDILVGIIGGKQKKIFLNGKSIELSNTRKVAILEEQPLQHMLFEEMSYMENLCFTMDHRIQDIWRNRKLQDSIRREYGEVLGKKVFEKNVKELSDTEKLDLLFGRIMLQKPELLICIQPYKGADFFQRVHIWELQKKCLKHGITILILAVNMADSLTIADRVLRIGKNVPMQEFSKKNFGALPISIPWSSIYDRTGEL